MRKSDWLIYKRILCLWLSQWKWVFFDFWCVQKLLQSILLVWLDAVVFARKFCICLLIMIIWSLMTRTCFILLIWLLWSKEKNYALISFLLRKINNSVLNFFVLKSISKITTGTLFKNFLVIYESNGEGVKQKKNRENCYCVDNENYNIALEMKEQKIIII